MYTAAHILGCTSKYLGMKAKALMKSLGRHGVAYGLLGSIGFSFEVARALRSVSSCSGFKAATSAWRDGVSSCGRSGATGVGSGCLEGFSEIER